VTASKLGAITRSGGSRQVAYNGHPVYLYVGDKQPGDVNGEAVTAFGAAWFALTPSGTQISARPTSSPAGTAGGY
jgi:predicted lipoprotein with Yx(FWY)xxD motif